MNFDGYIKCIISGTNSAQSFSFLRNRSMQSYLATITCFRMAFLTVHGLLTPQRFKVYKSIYIKYYFAKMLNLRD